MKTISRKASARPARKPATKPKTKTADALSICPVGGAGWCPYPFSIKQLKKRLKAKATSAR